MKVSLLDLESQYSQISSEIENAVINVLRKCNYILGENVKAFEKEIAEYCDAKYAVGVASGTDALLLALKAFDIGNGDEVITVPFTFFATAGVISRAGAKPVFVDIDRRTFNIDTKKIEEKINKNTKAIIPVHLFGQMADMEEIMKISKKYNIVVIEDGAQAIGAKQNGIKAGNFGQIGCFSFFPSKNLGGAGDGGLITTNNEEIWEKVKMLRVHGSKKKYYHEIIGYNSRLDEIQAAILRVKLKYLDNWHEKRRKNAKLYNELFKENKNVEVPYVAENNYSIYNQYSLLVERRDELKNYLDNENIGNAIYYPLPLHLQNCYKDLGYKKGDFPVAEEVAEKIISIPIYPELTEEEIRYVAEKINNFYEKY